jgi:SAM-dependent methyltransferase
MDIPTRFAILGDIAKETAKNLAMLFSWIRKRRLRYPRTAILSRDITEADLVEYGFPAFEMLLKHVPSSSIQGATVVEIGPGDNVVTGIPLLALGAAAYHAVDRFMGNVDSETARNLYARVAEELPKRYGIPREAVTDPSCYPRALVGSRVFLYRKGIEEYRSFNLAGVADLVFSHGVGQSVALPESFAQASYDILKPGGMAIHLMQFGPTGCWCRYPNPLTFLTVNGRLWKLTASHRGASNRVRCDEFGALFARSGLRVTTHVLEKIRRNHVNEIRPFLASPFKAVADESLEVAVAVFVCVKPG